MDGCYISRCLPVHYRFGLVLVIAPNKKSHVKIQFYKEMFSHPKGGFKESTCPKDRLDGYWITHCPQFTLDLDLHSAILHRDFCSFKKEDFQKTTCPGDKLDGSWVSHCPPPPFPPVHYRFRLVLVVTPNKNVISDPPPQKKKKKKKKKKKEVFRKLPVQKPGWTGPGL